jgi:fructose-bisphosphate aldolase class 1
MNQNNPQPEPQSIKPMGGEGFISPIDSQQPEQPQPPNPQMETAKTIDALSVPGKGILAADESTSTIQKRFESVGVESTPESRHHYRQALFSTEGLEQYIGGVILFDETIRNEETIAPLRDKGIQLGIKVDKGVQSYREQQGGCCGNENKTFSESITEGLDGLSKRLVEYKDLGATFAKWRAVLSPRTARDVIEINNLFLTVYAKKCQDIGIVPIVEPEILMEGDHPMFASYQATDFVDKAVTNLNSINQMGSLPWYVSFSFGRELQGPALKSWANSSVEEAQKELVKRASDCSSACLGQLTADTPVQPEELSVPIVGLPASMAGP